MTTCLGPPFSLPLTSLGQLRGATFSSPVPGPLQRWDAHVSSPVHCERSAQLRPPSPRLASVQQHGLRLLCVPPPGRLPARVKRLLSLSGLTSEGQAVCILRGSFCSWHLERLEVYPLSSVAAGGQQCAQRSSKLAACPRPGETLVGAIVCMGVVGNGTYSQTILS